MTIDTINDGGPAFPLKEPLTSDSLGMTLRDYFAAEAFAMMMHPDAKDYTPEETARQAYRFADAMLKERSK